MYEKIKSTVVTVHFTANKTLPVFPFKTDYLSIYVCMYRSKVRNGPFRRKFSYIKLQVLFYILDMYFVFLGYKLNYMSLPLKQALADHAPYLVQEIDIPTLKPQLQ